MFRPDQQSESSVSPLTEREGRYRDVVARMPAAVWTADIRGEILFANEQIEQMTGFTPEEFVSGGATLWARHVHPADIGSLFDKWNELFLRREGSLDSEYRFLRKDDQWVWLQQRISLVIEPERQPYIVGICVDVTARRNAEDALRSSELRYRMLVEQVRDVIFAIDLEGRFQSLNPAFETMTGWTCAEWIGRTFVELMDPSSVPQAVDRFREVLSGEGSAYKEYSLRTKWGHSITIEASSEGVLVDGRMVGSVGIARDITKRKHADAVAARESRLASVGQLATSVAHEFNNVLMSIMPFAELLQRRFPQDDRVTSATRHIIDAVRRGREISQQVLRFSRPVKPALKSIPVAGWLQEFGGRAEAMLGPQYRVVRRLDAEDGGLAISADPLLLDQVVTNLIANSRDAMPRGGTITISARRSRETGMIDIVVEDAGAGIADSVLDHIFEPLFTTKHGGSGLGLTVAHQAMKQQEGTISVESAIGSGSTFTVSFRESAPASPAAAPVMKTRGRMLIVEDDEAVGEGLRALLDDAGFDVRLVTRGLDAAPAVHEFKPDFVLLDINLPDVNGIEVYDRIRNDWADLPVIFSTGHADAIALEQLRHRDVPSIMKPYDVNELLAVIGNLPPN
ncbi:MAG TPA: PAS domain S-box protein [Thermoanaerobaculia bacterium]